MTSPKRVVIVGGGPSGLSAASELKKRGVPEVIVHEREHTAGGAPRHTDHLGFGMRDLRRILTGPQYAARLVNAAVAQGVDVRLRSTVFERPDADAVILATGARERPRAARLVPGDRSAGILTTGALQQLVQRGLFDGKRAVIVGAEHVSFSAIMTLRHAGAKAIAMVTDQAKHQTYLPLKLATATLRRVPVITGDHIAEIHGDVRVEAVTLDSGRRIECDTVIFSGDWIPDNELARHLGIALQTGYPAASVDANFATNQPGIYAIGNVAHAVKAADLCALDGRDLARHLTGR